MIDATSQIRLQTERTTSTSDNVEEEQAGFSFALAAATLQSQAALSLEVHGATPQNNTAGAGFGGNPQSQNSTSSQTDRSSSPAIREETAQTAPSSAPQKNSQPQSAVKEQINVLNTTDRAIPPQILTNPVTVAPQPITTSQHPTQTRETAALRESAAIKTAAKTVKTPAATRTIEPQVTQEFSRLLARRLDNATSFDLRLDPPELGRLEGRFTVNDDGKTVLALKFDNQAALDHFSKDEPALRAALSEAGYDLTQNSLTFTLREDNPQSGNSPTVEAQDRITANTTYEPLFNAPFSEGTIDIRI